VRLLLDEMLSPLVAQLLRDRGHDVEALVATPSYRAHSDDEVMALVREQRRALVTDDIVDFRPRHYAAIVPGARGHSGMVFLPSGYRRSRADMGRLVEALEAKLAEYPGDRDLADGETWLAR
jgi:nucleoside-diphosphate-sugar epimerase